MAAFCHVSNRCFLLPLTRCAFKNSSNPMHQPAYRLSARRPTAVATLVLALFSIAAQIGHAQAPPSGLHFFKNYFVTGGSVTGNVDFAPASGGNGFATATIPLSGVPPEADIVGAFLYWETIASGNQSSTVAGATFHAFDISTVTKQIGSRVLS